MRQQLLAARRQLDRYGWVGPKLEPWCRDTRGRMVHHDDEGVATFSVSGALQLAGADVDEAYALLGRIVSPGLAALNDFVGSYVPNLPELTLDEYEGEWDGPLWRGSRWVHLAAERRLADLERRAAGDFITFWGWLSQHQRTRGDVLRVFTTAILRSVREAA